MKINRILGVNHKAKFYFHKTMSMVLNVENANCETQQHLF